MLEKRDIAGVAIVEKIKTKRLKIIIKRRCRNITDYNIPLNLLLQ